MPITPVSYTPRPYVSGTSMGELMRLRGRNQADAELRRGDIQAQMWANLGQQLAGGIQNYAREKQEAPIRAQEAEARQLNLTTARTQQAEQQRELRGASIERGLLPLALSTDADGVAGFDEDLLTREFTTAGIADRLPGVIKSQRDFRASTLQLRKLDEDRQAAHVDAIANLAMMALDGGGTSEAAKHAVKVGIANKVLTQEEAAQALADITDDAGMQARLTQIASQSPAIRQELEARRARKAVEAQTAATFKANQQNVVADNARADAAARLAVAAQLSTAAYQRDRINIAKGAADTAASPTDAAPPLDPDSQDLMGQAGLTYNGFLALTGKMSQLPRDKETRNRASAEVATWARERGMDVSTLGSQYKAYNEALENNIQRYNRTLLAEGEIAADVTNLLAHVKETGLGDARAINAAKQWLKGELNDPNAAQYAFFLNQLTNDIALYNAASQGRATLQSDMEDAKSVVQRGISSGSLTGMQTAITKSVEKMGTVLEGAVDRSRKNVWDLFGVGDKYKPKGKAAPPSGGVPAVGSTFQGGRVLKVEKVN